MKKIIALILLMFSLAQVLSGCGCQRMAGSIYYLNFKPEVAGVYNRIATDYQKETGIDLRVVTAASGTYEQTLKSELGKSNAPSILHFNGPVGYRSWKEYCSDLSNTEIYQHLTDKSLALSDENGVWGIPQVVEGYGIIYNKAITDAYLALPNRSTNITSMDDIRSFSDFKAVVEDMSAHKNELGIEGVFGATSLKSGEDWRWTTHLANVALHYEFQDKGIDLTDPNQLKTVDFSYSDQYKQIFDLYINNSTTDKKLLGSKQVSDSMAEFALGKCAMIQNGNWAWSQIKDIEGNKVAKENIKIMPIYIGAEDEENQGICIGTENYLTINAKSDEQTRKNSADFLNWLYSSDTGKDYVSKELNFIAPYDTFKQDDRPDDPLSVEVMDWMDKEDIKNVTWDFVVFPSQNFKDDFGAALLQYAQGTISWQQVKDVFVTRWQQESV